MVNVVAMGELWVNFLNYLSIAVMFRSSAFILQNGTTLEWNRTYGIKSSFFTCMDVSLRVLLFTELVELCESLVASVKCFK